MSLPLTDRLRNEAVSQLRTTLERVLSCVVRTKLIARRQDAATPTVIVFETPGESVRLHSPLGLKLRVRLRARVGPNAENAVAWRAVVTAYQYTLLDREGREYLAYHWHPDGQSHMLDPHLHLGVAAQVGVAEIAAAHLPTGPVTLAAVARLALTDLGARPLRADWHSVLASAAPTLTPA